LSREAPIFVFAGKPLFLDDPFFTQSLSPTALALLRSEARQKSIGSGPRFQDYKDILANAEGSFRRFANAGSAPTAARLAATPATSPTGSWKNWSAVA
jgi:hypothetical protein